MASTSSRRGMSNRPLERQNTRSDDPWCLICGVNLALDGRTFSIVSCHQNSEISDALVHVLGMKFTEDHASVNVCNRCERQLKRLGRTTNIALARSEGRQLREQAEKNLAKHVHSGVEVGNFRDTSSSTSATSSTKPVRDGAATSTRTVKRGTSFDINTGGKTTREHYSRSTSVRVDDEKDDRKKGVVYRDHSAPERIIQKRERELESSWDEANKNKHVRSGTRSSAYSTSVERTSSVRTSSTDQKSPLERKSQQRASTVRDKHRTIAKANFVDAAKKIRKGSPGQMSANNGENDDIKPHGGSKKRDEDVDSPRALPRKIQAPDKDSDFQTFSSEQTNPFIFDEHEKGDDNIFDTTGPYGNDTTIQFKEDRDHSEEEKDYLNRKVNFEDVDGTAIKTDRSGGMVSSGGSESWNESNPERENGDSLTNSLTTDETLDYTSQNIDDGQNSGRNEDSDVHAASEDTDRPRKPKVTFSETVVSGDTRDEDQPERETPPATIRNEKGENQQDSAPLIGDSEENKEENKDGDELQEVTTRPGEFGDDVDGTDDVLEQSLKDVNSGQDERNEESHSGAPKQEDENDVMVNEVVQVTHLARPVSPDLVDSKRSEGVSFEMSSPEENESQISLPSGQTEDGRGVKSEVSPLIDKEAESSDKKGKKGGDSKFKDQQPGFACCTIL